MAGPLLRTLLRTLPQNPSQNLLRTLLRTLVLPYGPLGVHPKISNKKCPQNMPENEGSYGVKIPWNKGTFTENMVYEPTFMAYELRLLWHTNSVFYGIRTPSFLAYEPRLLCHVRYELFLFGGGGGLQYIEIMPHQHLSHSNATPLVSRYSCCATRCRIFRLTFSQCRTRITLHPLKCLKKGLSYPFGGGVAPQLCTVQIINCVAVQGVSQLQCRESRYTAPLRSAWQQPWGPKAH